jgi:hypothetical protein
MSRVMAGLANMYASPGRAGFDDQAASHFRRSEGCSMNLESVILSREIVGGVEQLRASTTIPA